MSKSNDSSGCALLIGVAVGIYVLYLLIIFSAKAFAYLGYNSIFYMDNLLLVQGASPLFCWAFMGLLLGAIFGVLISAKKHQLSYRLVLWPVGVLLAFATLMGFINKPAAYDGQLALPANEYNNTATGTTYNFYKVISDVNVRSGPSINNSILFTLSSGTEVELIDRGYYDSKNAEWIKVSYAGQQGYVNGKFLTFSRTYP